MAKSDRTRDSQADILFGATTVSSPPTAIELAALTQVDNHIVEDGEFSAQRTGTSISIAGLSDAESAAIAGRIINEDIETTYWHELDGTDAVWVLFDDQVDPIPTQTYVTCPAGFTSGTPTAGDVVNRIVGQVSRRSDQPYGGGGDSAQRFDVTFTVIEAAFGEVVA